MNADFEMLAAAEALDAAIVQTAEGEVLYWNPWRRGEFRVRPRGGDRQER
jgi:hypothetical protein